VVGRGMLWWVSRMLPMGSLEQVIDDQTSFMC
jgi:hypothetical protein